MSKYVIRLAKISLAPKRDLHTCVWESTLILTVSLEMMVLIWERYHSIFKGSMCLRVWAAGGIQPPASISIKLPPLSREATQG